MITEEINDIVNKFGNLVEKIIENAGNIDVVGNQVMFTRDPSTNKSVVLGVCFMIPHAERHVVYYRVLTDGTIGVLAPDSENPAAPAPIEDVSVLGEDYQQLYEYIKVIGKHLTLSTFANFIVEKQEIVLAVQEAAQKLNAELDELYPNVNTSNVADETAQTPKTKVKKPRKKKTIEITNE